MQSPISTRTKSTPIVSRNLSRFVSLLCMILFQQEAHPPQKKSVDPIDLIPPPEKLNFALVVITTRTYQPPAKRQAKEMQSLSVLCAQPLGLENAGDMSAGDLRSWETQGWWVIAWSDGC